MHAMLYTDFLHLVFPSWIVSGVYGDFFPQQISSFSRGLSAAQEYDIY